MLSRLERDSKPDGARDGLMALSTAIAGAVGVSITLCTRQSPRPH